MKGTISSISLLFLLLSTSVTAIDRYCNGDTGDDDGDCASAVAPCRTFGYAHDQSKDGDTLRMTGDFHFTKTNMVVVSLHILGAPFARLLCDGIVRNGLYFTSLFSELADVEVSGCTGTSLVYDYEGPSSPHIVRNVYIHDSFVGIGAVHANMTIDNSRFERITQGAIIHSFSPLTVRNTVFVNNTFGVYQPSCAAAIHTVRTQLTLENIVIDHHPISADDECVAVHVGIAPVTMTNVSFSNNEIPLLRLDSVPSSDLRSIQVDNSNVYVDDLSLFIISGSNSSISNMIYNGHSGSVIAASLFSVDGASMVTLTSVRWNQPVKGAIVQCAADHDNVIITHDSSSLTTDDVVCRPGCSLNWDGNTVCKP